jgi:hypothetical protein
MATSMSPHVSVRIEHTRRSASKASVEALGWPKSFPAPTLISA